MAEGGVSPSELHWINQDESVDLSSTQPINLQEHRLQFDPRAKRPRASLEGAQNNVSKLVLDLLPRSYQFDLAQPCLAGHNTIVCAPTGSGKTIVAVYVIRKHLLSKENAAKVVFVVPTVELCHQQFKVMNDYLCDRWSIGECFGGPTAVSKSTLTVFNSRDIVVTTAGCLLNALHAKDHPFDLGQITLLVLDECHHTNEMHPYNELMHEYQERWISDDSLPQVLGLTASLGVGGKSTAVQAMDHIKMMCANLCSCKLSCFDSNAVNVTEEGFVVVEEEIRIVQSNHASEEFYKKLVEIMEIIERNLWSKLNELSKNNPDFELENIPGEHHTLLYEQWISELLRNKIPTVSEIAGDEKRKIISCLQQLKMYFKALEMHSLLPSELALKYLEKRIEDIQKDMSPWDAGMVHLWLDRRLQLKTSAGQSSNTLWLSLCQLLTEQYRQSPDSRTIVFVRTRELASALTDLVNSNPLSFATARYLTSVHAKSTDCGQEQSGQTQVLQEFRDGKINLIFATTVADEGLDVAECNLVVKYNYVTDEVAMVQRRGRGRAANSRAVLLTQEAWIKDQEENNVRREILMDKALKEVVQIVYFEQWVRQKVGDLVSDRRAKRAVRNERTAKLEHGSEFKILCRKCETVICFGDSVRCINGQHRICVDPSIWDKTNPQKKAKFVYRAEIFVVCKSYCKIEGCDPWGAVIKYKGILLPALSADAIVIQKIDCGEKTARKQWKKYEEKCFVVEEIERGHLEVMADKFRKMFPILTKDIEAEIERLIENLSIKQNDA